MCFTALNVVRITEPQNPKNVVNVLIIVNNSYIFVICPQYMNTYNNNYCVR